MRIPPDGWARALDAEAAAMVRAAGGQLPELHLPEMPAVQQLRAIPPMWNADAAAAHGILADPVTHRAIRLIGRHAEEGAALVGAELPLRARSIAALVENGPSEAEVLTRIHADIPAEHLGKLRGDVPDDVHRQVAENVHRELVNIFIPVADDLVTETARLRDVPLAEIPRAGTSVTVGPHPYTNEFRMYKFRDEVHGHEENFRRLDTVARSNLSIGADINADVAVSAMLPVGDYGEHFAASLVEAGRAVNAAAIRLQPELDSLTQKYPRLLASWTFQGDAGRAALVGGTTYTGATAIFTHRRVGTLSADELLAEMANSNLYDRAARGPTGLIGPMSFEGFVPAHSIAFGKSGRLEYAPEFREIDRATNIARGGDGRAPQQTNGTDRGCPISPKRLADLMAVRANDPSGKSFMTLLAGEYLDLARRFNAAKPQALHT